MIPQKNNGIMVENKGQIVYLMKGATAGKSPIVSIETDKRVYQIILTGSGVLTATVVLRYSLDPSDSGNFIDIKTFSLNGTDRVVDAFVSEVPWAYVQAEITAITGTNAAIDLILGV